MPPKFYKKRRTYRRRGPLKGYRKKTYQKKARTMTKMTNVRKDLYYYKKKRIGVQIDLTAAPTGALQFQLGDVPVSAEITAMFDQYMLYGVKIDFRLIYSPDSTGNVASSIYPNLYVRKDYDNNALESTAQIIQSNKSRRLILQPNRTRSVYVRPAILTTARTAGGIDVTRPVWKQWVDCSHDDVAHFGLKYAIDTMGQALPANTRHLQIDYTYYLAAKNTR